MPPKRKATTELSRTAKKPRADLPQRNPYSLRKRMAQFGVPPEVKVMGNVTFLGLNTTGTTQSLTSLITQGDTGSSRDGNQVFIRDITLRILSYAAQPTTTPQLWGIALVMDKQANNPASSPTWASVFDTANPQSFPIWQQRDRYKILKKIIMPQSLQSSTRTGENPSERYWEVRVPVNQFVTYNASTGGVSDVVQNAIYLMGIGNAASGAGFGADVHTRITFFD